MKIEVGKSYRTRSGNRIDISYEDTTEYPFDARSGECFTNAGKYWFDEEWHEKDLVALWDDPVDEPKLNTPIRVEILREGEALTHGARDAEYGPPAINMAAAGEMKHLMRRHATRTLSPAEWEALDMVVTKLSRLLTGTPKRDTYVDMAAYAAIAGEIALTPNSD